MRFNCLLCIVLCAALGIIPGRAQNGSGAIRLDDQLSSASLQASSKTTNVNAAEPVVWQNFLSKADVTWQLIRGTMDVHNGDLLVKGGGATPVIFAPKQPAIDWKLYSAVEVRMSAQGGREVKIKIGDFEARQKLGPVGQYNVYRFDVNVDAPKGSRVLGVMPTDSLTDAVAIHSIKLIPKAAGFERRAGIENVGKRDEYRNTVYVHSPATLGFRVAVPQHGHLHFGMGITAKQAPVTFHVLADGATVFSRKIADVDRWEDGDVDLSRWGGRDIEVQLQTESGDGAVALWSHPLITSALPHPKWNVLIYTSDTLRADHASVYGYSRDTTPFLKKLGASGIVFEDCQAQATWTKASIASLMTSLYSFTHGIMRDSDTIPPGAATLAEQLRKAGYVTASIVSTPFVGRATGLERGFDYLLEYPVVLREHNQQTERDTDSEALNRVVFPWLDAHRAEPFFLYAHATDPHAPYNPPPSFESRFANPAETPAFHRAYASLHGQHQYGGGAVASPEIARKAGLDPDRFIHQAIDRYDGEILHNDHSIELLTEKLKQLGVLQNTLVIVLSDHGEEFWDHGWTGHGQSVYQELTHTMLLMSNPLLFKTPRRVSEPVQLIDVMPTVLDVLNLKAPTIVEGQSLLPLARGQSFQRRGLVMASRFAAVKPEGLVPENATDSFAIIDSKWKFIFRNKAARSGIPRVELYDRRADREERHDISAQHPEQVEQKMTQLRQWLEAQKKISGAIGHSGTTTLDPRTIEQMRSLGYLGGPSQ